MPMFLGILVSVAIYLLWIVHINSPGEIWFKRMMWVMDNDSKKNRKMGDVRLFFLIFIAPPFILPLRALCLVFCPPKKIRSGTFFVNDLPLKHFERD